MHNAESSYTLQTRCCGCASIRLILPTFHALSLKHRRESSGVVLMGSIGKLYLHAINVCLPADCGEVVAIASQES